METDQTNALEVRHPEENGVLSEQDKNFTCADLD